ncbi:hypothetical protein C0J52_26254 [Blattella germanica]|nr:hypothetical protein C0J52_26254 [Blattella germanica]
MVAFSPPQILISHLLPSARTELYTLHLTFELMCPRFMRKAFQMFDTTKSGFIETLKISTILNTMGQLFDDGELQTLIEETDPEGKFSY